jgi:hypothetical protein
MTHKPTNPTQPKPVRPPRARRPDRAHRGASGVVHHRNHARQALGDILTPVEHIFTGLLVLVTIFVMWFAGYVVYRLYSDQR